MQKDGAAPKKSSSKQSAVIHIIFGAYLLYSGYYRFRMHATHAPWAFWLLEGVALVFGFLLLVLGVAAMTGTSALGPIGHEQIFDHRLEERVRERYGTEIRQLTFLGFNYVFTESESFALYRILLVFPALVLLAMLRNREVLTFGRGGKILILMPVFCSVDGRTFAHPFAMGVKFQTVFRNGQLLVTKNFKTDCCETPEFVIQAAQGSISEAWQTHQEWLRKLDTDTNPANRDRSYEAFVAISTRENDFLKSQS
jgi:hypothetical protein